MANNENIKNEEQVEVMAEEKVVVNKDSKLNVKDKKSKKSKDKKVNPMSKTWSELKKVSWPSFGQVVKQTSVVIVVTLAFLLVVFGLDRLCSLLVGLIVS